MDDLGNCYGSRCVATNVDVEESTGTITSYATIYNINTDEFTDSSDFNSYTCGTGDGLTFTGDARVIDNGTVTDIVSYYDVDNIPSTMAGINKISDYAHVVGGMRYEFNEATGENSYYPVVIATANAGVKSVYGGDNVSFMVQGRNLSVRNADSMDVFDLSGNIIGSGASVNVPAGVYLLKAGDKCAKVIVK